MNKFNVRLSGRRLLQEIRFSTARYPDLRLIKMFDSVRLV